MHSPTVLIRRVSLTIWSKHVVCQFMHTRCPSVVEREAQGETGLSLQTGAGSLWREHFSPNLFKSKPSCFGTTTISHSCCLFYCRAWRPLVTFDPCMVLENRHTNGLMWPCTSDCCVTNWLALRYTWGCGHYCLDESTSLCIHTILHLSNAQW